MMEKIKPVKFCLLGTLFMALVLVSCAPKPETVFVEVQSTVVVERLLEVPKEIEVERKVNQTILVASRVWGSSSEQEFLINEIIKPFEKETGYVVNFQAMTDDAMLAQAEAQSASDHVTVDAVIVDHYQIEDWIDAGLVQDVSELAAGWEDRQFVTSFSETTDRDGQQFFLPVDADVYLMVVNKNALVYLPAGARLNALTWEEFVQWAANIVEGEGVGKTAVTGMPRKTWIYHFGSTALSYGAGFPEMNSDGAKEAWAIWAAIGAADGFIPDVRQVSYVEEVIQRGEAWLTFLHCSQAASLYLQNEGKLSIAPMPSGPEGIGSVAGFRGVGLVEGAPNQEGAEAFITYLTSPEVQVKLEKGTNGLIPTVLESRSLFGRDPQGEVMAAGLSVLEAGVLSETPADDFQDWGAVKQVFDDTFLTVVLRNWSTLNEAALENAAEQLEELRK
jgi:multiple sugar transport system substrate-binding protein